MPYVNSINFDDSRPVIMRIDYVDRTDHQPVYQGFAETRAATTDKEWMIYKFTYSADPGWCTQRDVAYGAWDDRTSLSYS